VTKLVFPIVVIFMIAAGCLSCNSAATGQPPVINSFDVTPGNITSGESSTLSWSVSDATAVSVDQGIGNVALSGTRVLSPNTTTKYTLTATNDVGNVTATADLVVVEKAVVLPAINSFAAEPKSIAPGDSSTLTWNASGTAEVAIAPDVGNVEPIGSTLVSPQATITYTLTATNESGSVTATAQVMVAVPSLHTMSLFSIGGEDGHIIEGGVIHPHLYPGDTDKNRARQAFLSFDISEIPTGATIKSASLDLSGGDELGEPFVGLGVMRVYDDSYGTLDGGDFTSGFPGGEMHTCYSRPLGPFTSSGLVNGLQGRVDAGASRFQVRLQFQKHTEGNYRDDMLRVRQPEIVITYEE